MSVGCSAEHGNYHCSGHDHADTALLYCDGAPGATFGSVKVANSDDQGSAPVMFWSHEIYNPPTVPSLLEAYRDHYVSYPGAVCSNGSDIRLKIMRCRPRRLRFMLETTGQSVEQIAARVGFGSAATLRDRFGRIVGASPQAYRRAFRSPSSRP